MAPSRASLLTAVLALALVATLTGPATGLERTSGVFADDDRSTHERAIEALAASGITRGCGLGTFCPTSAVTRGQMAAFVTRAFSLPASPRDWFVDDAGHTFADPIDRMRAAGLTSGCNPPDNDRYCPDALVTRAQMAVFLGRALGLPASDRDWFVDDDGSQFEPAIQAFREARVTVGCNPPDNDRYCPDAPVSREQMATFIVRALELEPLTPQGGTTCTRPTHACTASELLHPVALTWDGLELRLPSSGTELVGQHQSTLRGARELSATGAVQTVVLDSRGRGTGRGTAADIVSHPEVEVRAPVDGTVKRSGTYRLYCRYSDDFLVIEPDGRPGIEVKMLHIDGVRVTAGERVVAGVTIVARRPTVLPFASQVDDSSRSTDWPHVHIEVVDTSVPEKPSSGGGC